MGKIKRIIKLLAILCTMSGLIVSAAMNAFADDSTAAPYISITMEEAKEIFMKVGDYIILDVRRDDEFVEGHIPGAINIANEDIISEPPERLTDFDQVIYVYCRSGRRSKEASAKLADMGYRNIIEFGGILDWTGDVETGPERTSKRVKPGIAMYNFLAEGDLRTIDFMERLKELLSEIADFGCEGIEWYNPILNKEE